MGVCLGERRVIADLSTREMKTRVKKSIPDKTSS